MPIKFIPYQELNFSKWDSCINTSRNSEIYANSWFLDSVIDRWDAIVENDYEKVMPLPVRKFLGRPVVYQPVMVPQLGIFSPGIVDKETIKKFTTELLKRYNYFEFPCNKFFETDKPFARFKLKPSFDLDLIAPYGKTASKYAKEVKQKIISAENSGFFVSKGLVPNEIINFHRNLKWPYFTSFGDLFYNKLRRLISVTIQNKTGETFGVYSKENNICALGFVIKTLDRIVLYLLAADKTGVKNNCTFLLIDHIIKLHSEKDLTLRFEPFGFHRIIDHSKLCIEHKKKNLRDQYLMFSAFGAKKFTYPIFYNKQVFKI